MPAADELIGVQYAPAEPTVLRLSATPCCRNYVVAETRSPQTTNHFDGTRLYVHVVCCCRRACGKWLPENHLAYVVSDVIDQLDLSAKDDG